MTTELERCNNRLGRDRFIRRVFSLAQGETWLVGGYIRDNLIHKRSPRRPRDLDFVVNYLPDRLAFSLKREFGGTIVPLKDEAVTRIVLKNKDIIDISLLNANIDNDLGTRDYTLNAIAWNPNMGFLDPLGGIRDITSKKIRLISKKNLISDPLRLIRAYRMVAITGFKVDSRTRKVIKGLSSLATEAAGERVTYELIKIISGLYYKRALKDAFDDGVLAKATGLKAETLQMNLDKLAKLHRRVGWVSERWLKADAGQGIDNKIAMRLSALIMGADSPRLVFCRSFQHRALLAAELLNDFSALRLKDKERVFDMLSRAGEVSVDLSLLAGKKWALDEYRRYLRARSHPLVSARDLIEHYGMRQGPEIGIILGIIERARFLGVGVKKSEIQAIIKDNTM